MLRKDTNLKVFLNHNDDYAEVLKKKLAISIMRFLFINFRNWHYNPEILLPDDPMSDITFYFIH